MSGTIVGKVDVYTNVVNNNGNQERFVALKRFLDLHVTAGNATLHASNYGNGASGFNYHDEANPAGQNAFAVYKFLASASTNRTTDFYLLIQWADTDAFGASPGNPGLLDNSTTDGIGIQMAYREANGDPWNGTTNANGADTKGATVWTGADMHLIHYDPADAGANQENCLRPIQDMITSPRRFHMVGDADTIVILDDFSDNGSIDYYTVFGVYKPFSGVVANSPYFLFCSENNTLAGTYDDGVTKRGQIIGVDESDGPKDFTYLGGPARAKDNQPSVHGAQTAYADFPIYLSQKTGTVNSGLIGSLHTEIVSWISGLVSYPDTNAALDRAYLFTGDTNTSTNPNSDAFSIAWGSGSPPNTGVARGGREF
jgi:hypothetical protein